MKAKNTTPWRMLSTWVGLGLASLCFQSGVAIASHESDGTYDESIFRTWNRTILNVLIIPPEHGQIVNGNGVLAGFNANELNPYENSYLGAIEGSIDMWRQAIALYGSPQLKQVTINDYVVGRDNIPTGVLLNPQIVILSDETKAIILGVAINLTDGLCIVDNSKFFVTSFSDVDMFNINGQEFGHCLGLDHVVDGHPERDVMNGTYPYNAGDAGNPLQCFSNLNVKTLELIFAEAFDQPPPAADATASIPVDAYQAIPSGCGQ